MKYYKDNNDLHTYPLFRVSKIGETDRIQFYQTIYNRWVLQGTGHDNISVDDYIKKYKLTEISYEDVVLELI